MIITRRAILQSMRALRRHHMRQSAQLRLITDQIRSFGVSVLSEIYPNSALTAPICASEYTAPPKNATVR